MTLPLPNEAVRLQVTVADWREAIREAGAALVAAGAVTPTYTDEMVASVEKLGPYIVIAPGIALAHARPSPAVLRAGLSWVSLATPVEFGNSANDPVSLVVGLAAPSPGGHLDIMAELAEILSDDERMALAMTCTTAQQLRETLEGRMMKIVTVCGAGIGTSVLLKMNTEKALRALSLEDRWEVQATDVATAREVARTADIVLTSADLVEAIGKVPARVIVIHSFTSVEEVTDRLREYLR